MEFIPKEIEETIVEYEPVERTWERVQYLPVETQIVHYPEHDNYVAGQGQYIQGGYTTNSSYQTGATYVPNASGVRQETSYQTGYAPTGSSVVHQNGGYSSGQAYNSGYQQSGISQGGLVQGGQQYSSSTGGQYVSGGQSGYTGGQTAYTNGQTTYTNTTTGGQYPTGQTGQTYVTGGSGVRGSNVGENAYRTSQTGGYVTGGSGVRQN